MYHNIYLFIAFEIRKKNELNELNELARMQSYHMFKNQSISQDLMNGEIRLSLSVFVRV